MGAMYTFGAIPALLDTVHVLLLFKTLQFGHWILSEPSGGTY
jgi:hypothetical protein